MSFSIILNCYFYFFTLLRSNAGHFVFTILCGASFGVDTLICGPKLKSARISTCKIYNNPFQNNGIFYKAIQYSQDGQLYIIEGSMFMISKKFIVFLARRSVLS